MFDVGFDEMLVIAIVAIVVIGPKDLPRALRLVGQWVAKVRRVSGHFRTGIETMIREAELEEMEKQWKAQNEAVMHETAQMHFDEGGAPVVHPASAEANLPPPASKADAMTRQQAQEQAQRSEPPLPVPPSLPPP